MRPRTEPPFGNPTRRPTRRAALRLMAGGAALPLAASFVPARARAADYPPTNGAMQGFILYDKRRELSAEPFLDGAGNTRHFADFRGRVLLVNFWATWCAPCIEEMPDLAALQDGMGGEDFTVLAISQDRGGRDVAEPFVRDRLGLPRLPVLYDPNSALGRAMGVKGLPTTFLIDRRGRAVGHYLGAAEWNAPGARAMIRHVIDEAGSDGLDPPLDQA